MNSLQKQERIINIRSKDIQSLNIKEDNYRLSNTLSTLIEIYNIDNICKPYINSFGYSSAINPLSRFHNIDNQVNELISSIIEIEDNLETNEIKVEIVHTSDLSASNNILIRPKIKKYDLLYLGNTNSDNEFKINIDDLHIKIDQNDNIILFSKKLNSKISVCLNSTHNYKIRTLPMYNFLCDLHEHEKKHLDFDFLPVRLPYIPRIEIDNIIFQKERWYFFREDIEELLTILNKESYIEDLSLYRESRQIPDELVFVSGDQEVLINFNNHNSVNIFKSLIKGSVIFFMTEFIHFSKSNIVKDDDEKTYASQFLFTIYKQNQ
ncbi:lantibiotic dehydratase [Chryseobacterium sp. 3008163]|uniref:lantibiotic dehydratase n=1 Tax=Chryseobacterium sp. 3008163 TaxID=2478663 RepID=UPI000F0CC0DF|nr:lantibiotic dehydratase [Chryseobacterium sp. 3008163]AYN02209.1 hypothetical protein EAG08_19615 [Chryseobacterium sp. 3008163]